MSFRRINIEQCRAMLREQNPILLDIRDTAAFDAGHLADAVHIETLNLAEFIEDTPKDQPIVVYCYHGHSSQQAAGYLAAQGFSAVASLDGGYEAWRVAETD